jgi:hypothetical protein
MTHITYRIVRHDEGWAYKVGDVFSERFNTHEEALQAAKRAAREQQIPGATHDIEYEDDQGRWRTESAPGTDRPETDVEDTR